MGEFSNELKSYLDFKNSEECRYFRKLYSRDTIFDITGISRQENPHSSFIKWLLDINGSHGLNDYPIKRFIETVCFAYFKYGQNYLADNNYTFNHSDKKYKNNVRKKLLFFDNNDPNKPLYHLMNGNYKITEFTIERERVLSKKRRADIWLDFSVEIDNSKPIKIALLIENKVNSSENDSQTNAYMADMLDSDYDYIIPVFLYPISKKELQKAVNNFSNENNNTKYPCVNHLFLLLNYQYLLDGVFLNCLNELDESSVAFQYLNEYIISLGRAEIIQSERNSIQSNTKKIVMATKKSDTEKARVLWEKHSETILKLAGIISGKDTDEMILISESDSELYSTIINHICLSLNEKEKLTESENSIIALTKEVNNQTVYYINDGSGIIEFKARGEHNIGELAYRMIRFYANENNATVDNIRTTLNIKSKWLRNIVISNKEINGLFEDWKNAHKKNRKCPYTSMPPTTVENGKLSGCPLNENSANPLNKIKKEAVDPNILNGKTCPLFDKTNKELFVAFTNNNYCCQCFYDYLHYFFIGEDNKYVDEFIKYEGKEPVRINKKFGIVENKNDNKESFYVARFFEKENINTLIRKFNLTEYVATNPNKVSKELIF